MSEDIQKQKAFVANKRSVSNKQTRRSVRKRMGTIENVTVKLVNELRSWLQAQQAQNDQTNIILPIVVKWTAGETLGEEDLGVLKEYLEKQPKADDGPEPSPDAVAGS